MVMALAALPLVAGCAEEVAPPEEEEEEEEWPSAIVIGTSSPGSAYYAIATGISAMIEKYVGISCVPQDCVGISQAISLLSRGEVDLVLASGKDVYDAMRGEEAFATVAPIPLQLISGGHDVPVHVTTRPETGITSVADFTSDTRVIFEYPGASLTPIFGNTILEAYGMTKADVQAVPVAGYMDLGVALKEGRTDVIIWPTGIGGAMQIELASSIGAYLIPLDSDKVDWICEKCPFFVPLTIPASTYQHTDSDVLTIATRTAFWTGPNIMLPESLVYEIMKVVLEHPEEFAAYHPVCKYWTIESGLPLRVAPFHPGAVEYYKEKGVCELESFQQDALKK